MPVPGSSYTHTYTYTVPEEFKLQDLYAVGLVEHRPGGTSRTTLNAVTSMHVPVGIDEAASTAVSVHPNPFDRWLAVNVLDMNGNATLTLRSMDGRIVFQKNVVLDVNGSTVVAVDDMPAAPYLLQIDNGRTTATRRIVRVSR
jgi:hypothetical protein